MKKPHIGTEEYGIFRDTGSKRSGKAVVTATGMSTEMGRIACLVSSAEPQKPS